MPGPEQGRTVGEAAPAEVPTLGESGSGASLPPLPAVFALDDLIASRYRITALRGRGGMGEVYEAEDQELGVRVALKAVRPQLAADPAALRRFKQEVLLARAVTHPSVCRVYDVSRHDGLIFLTMELLEGDTLRTRIAERGRLDPDEALPLVRQLAAGLDAAHRVGIVHRDFKSANVMLVGDKQAERAVVTDFGLAHAAVGDGMEGGRPEMIGTAAYMAPEQVRGERAGPAADLYALGVVLFEMVTGALPFPGTTPMATALRRLAEEPPTPATLVALEPHWEQTILRLMAREPEARFASALDAVRALEGKPARSAERHTLPAEADAFVGREAELMELGRRLGSGARLVTLHGPGGAGKTRLARRFGWTSLEQWPGGIWFCDLSEARSLDGIVAAAATGLEMQLRGGDPVVQLGHAIAGRGRALVILDNFEQVAEQAEGTVGRWVARAGEAAFLVTSRERLGLPCENVLALEPLLVDGAGLELFELRARAHMPDFALGAANREAASDVVRLVEGFPLAIELAAARVRVLTLEQIRARLEDRFRVLVGPKGSSTRRSALRASIDWSWDLLAEWEKAALAQATVFEGGFSIEAAEAVLDLSTWPETPPVLDVVQSLVDKSLVRLGSRERAEDPPRFTMYVSIAEFAREKLLTEGAIARGGSGPDAKRAAEERHARHFARLGADDAIESLNGHGGVVLRRRLGPELENLVAACRRAILRRDGETAARTYRAAAEVLTYQGPYPAAVDLGLELTRLEELPLAERAAVLCSCGRALTLAGRAEEARDSYELELAIRREIGDRRSQGDVLDNLADLYRRQGQREEAQQHFESALTIHRELGHRRFEGRTVNGLGLLNAGQGRHVEARDHYERALTISREVGDRHLEGIVHGNLGIVDYVQGRLEEAREHFERALTINREVGNRDDEGCTLGNLGNVRYRQGRVEEAREHYERALVILREVGARLPEGVFLCCVGELDLMQGRTEVARAQFERALAIFRDTGDLPWESEALSDLAGVHEAQGQPGQAREHYEKALAIHRDVGDRQREGMALAHIGTLLAEAGNLVEAGEDYERALAILRGVGARGDEGLVLGFLADLHVSTGRLVEAREALASSEALLREAGDCLLLIIPLGTRGELERLEGQLPAARATLAEAEALAASVGIAPGSRAGRTLARLRQALAAGS